MGLRRWLRRNVRGVVDLTQETDQRGRVYYTIDHASFQQWVVFVAAIGFLTDAYDIFALSIITEIIPYIYGDSPGLQAGLLVSTLAGTMLGQIIFGILGDLVGRRKMYGYELLILIVASIGTAMSSEGRNSMSIWGWLVAWRFIMGVGIGADYPLSAVIAAEFAPRHQRARMLASVFYMQPIGQVIVFAVALIAIQISRPWLLQCGCLQPSDTCLTNLDSLWRWVVGLGAVPAALAIWFRMGIPQSPRFLMDNKQQVEKAARQTEQYFPTPDVPFSQQMAQLVPRQRQLESVAAEEVGTQAPFDLGPSAFPDTETSYIERSPSRASSVRSASPGSTTPTNQRNTGKPVSPDTFYKGFQDYLFGQGNWRLLLGTAGNWFLLDVPFYGLGLSSASIVKTIWNVNTTTSTGGGPVTMYDVLLNNTWHSLIIVSLGPLIGGGVFLKIVKFVSPKTIQFWGFIVLTILLLVTGLAFPTIAQSGGGISIVLYVLIQGFFSLGPNTTTYMIAAEIFPTQYRCTCHGISGAAGRIGGILAQIIIVFVPFNGSTLASESDSTRCSLNPNGASDQSPTVLGRIMAIFCIFTAFGAALTWLLTPETRDNLGRPRSLETLAKGYSHLKKLNGKPDPDDEELYKEWHPASRSNT